MLRRIDPAGDPRRPGVVAVKVAVCLPALISGDPRRPGVVAVKVAVCLPALISVVALSLEGSLLFDNRRRAQAGADAAALAAASDLFKTYTNASTADDGKDVTGAIAVHAKAVAAVNGFTDDKTNSEVVVNIPPKSGDSVGKDGFAEVLITFQQRRGFSSIFGQGDLPVAARAVARGQWAAHRVGVLVLDPTGSSSLKINGGGQGLVPNAPVIVNSTATDAVYGNGTGCSLTAQAFEVTGGIKLTDPGILVGPITTGVPPVPDPFRFLPAPDPNNLPLRSLRQAKVVNTGGGAKTYYLEPGVYIGGLSFSGQESVVMAPGVYYMMGGGFKFSGNEGTSLTATGVMVYNAPGANGQATNADISITGSASVQWTPPIEGPYQGMTLFQARGMTTAANISGGGSMKIEGAFYFPSAPLSISGGGGAYIGNQVVTYQLSMGGNGTFNCPWDAGKLPRVREYRLTEQP